MQDLIDQLLALTGQLEAAAGVPASALDALRRWFAAALIQQNPALAPVVQHPDVDPAINAAALAGEALAAERSAAGVRLAMLREHAAGAGASAQQAARVFGPFIDGDASLVQFSVFETAAFTPVVLDVDFVFFHMHDVPMLLPGGTVADAERRNFSIPPGTVWLRAARLVPAATGYVVLRVAGGALQLGLPASQAVPGAPIQLAGLSTWQLVLVPEPAAPLAGGSDGNALDILLPSTLTITSDGNVAVAGALSVAGFGSPLQFDAAPAAPAQADAAIVFVYPAPALAWTVAGNRSALANFDGTCAVRLGIWSLPVTQVPIEQAFEAAHGGTLSVALQGVLNCSLGGTAPGVATGRLALVDPRLTANALGLELRSRRPDAALQLALSLWGPARSRIDWGQGLADLRFISRRNAADSLTAAGGQLRNRWDLPRAASGQPFPCDATLTSLSFIAEPDGTRRIACAAQQQGQANVPMQVQGLALPNLYLQVLPMRSVAFAGSGAAADDISQGRAQLVFDVLLGEPMLPDPYAANWGLPDARQAAASALSVALRWQPGADTTLQARLDQPINYPEPRDLPAESDANLGGRFSQQINGQPEFLSLLDLSSQDHHFGIALESLSDQQPSINSANCLTVALRDVRLLMQPQVHWEPVQVVPNKDVGILVAEQVQSATHGGRTLVGANAATLVPLLPGRVGSEIVAAANGLRNAAALFSLPFGLRAFVRMAQVHAPGITLPAVLMTLQQSQFDGLAAANALRLVATGGQRDAQLRDPARQMPGGMHQTPNLTFSANGLKSVLPDDIVNMLPFDNGVPLHAVDLSGYGLSCFSRWRRDPAAGADAFGVTQVRLDVLVGRTAYEVIEVRSVLAPCQARVVRTIVLERGNSGRVQRFDSGWQAIDDGLFQPYAKFDTGVLRALRRIRHIRLLAQPALKLSDNSVWQPVQFDADAQIDDLIAGGSDSLVPALDQSGYIQLAPVWRRAGAPPAGLTPDAKRFALLFQAVGGPIGGAVDCRIRLGGSLDMHLHHLLADLAPDDGGAPGFAVAAYGAPTLPLAGTWTAVRIDTQTSDVSPVDPQRGLPVVRRPGRPYTFRDPADARRTLARAEHGLLLSTPSSRVLFPRPSVDPAQPGSLRSAAPLMADPLALLQASSVFPRAAFALRAAQPAVFGISAANAWQLSNPRFAFNPPLPDVASGTAWGLQRVFGPALNFDLAIDSAVAAAPWQLLQPPDKLDLHVDPFPGVLFSLESNFKAASGALAGLQKPTLVFGPALDALQDIVNALRNFVNLPFDLQVDVAAGSGPSPSFTVRLHLLLRIGEGPDSRIDIGIGKFYGQFTINAELQAGLGGVSAGQLLVEFTGDVQQAILPPLLYAGGAFRFAIQIKDGGKPLIEMGLGTATSIGGDLIKGLLEVEATVTYGYTLIPETLQPGVMLGIEARCKLLAGLFALSFGADAMARLQRLNNDSTVTIFADLRVAGSVQVAVFFKERVDFRTQFEQNIPLGLLQIVAGINPIVAAASTAAALL